MLLLSLLAMLAADVTKFAIGLVAFAGRFDQSVGGVVIGLVLAPLIFCRVPEVGEGPAALETLTAGA